jgi:hypothetical protein
MHEEKYNKNEWNIPYLGKVVINLVRIHFNYSTLCLLHVVLITFIFAMVFILFQLVN